MILPTAQLLQHIGILPIRVFLGHASQRFRVQHGSFFCSQEIIMQLVNKINKQNIFPKPCILFLMKINLPEQKSSVFCLFFSVKDKW
ncbi:hypothetical protein X975_17228, partial [Stegodyphus mimosarum]